MQSNALCSIHFFQINLFCIKKWKKKNTEFFSKLLKLYLLIQLSKKRASSLTNGSVRPGDDTKANSDAGALPFQRNIITPPSRWPKPATASSPFRISDTFPLHFIWAVAHVTCGLPPNPSSNPCCTFYIIIGRAPFFSDWSAFCAHTCIVRT